MATHELDQLTQIKLATADFILECMQCDAGQGIDTYQQAIEQGWREIHFDDGPGWNFLGVCNDCSPRWFGEETENG